MKALAVTSQDTLFPLRSVIGLLFPAAQEWRHAADKDEDCQGKMHYLSGKVSSSIEVPVLKTRGVRICSLAAAKVKRYAAMKWTSMELSKELSEAFLFQISSCYRIKFHLDFQEIQQNIARGVQSHFLSNRFWKGSGHEIQPEECLVLKGTW